MYILWAPMSVMSARFYINVKNVAARDPFFPGYSSIRKETTGGTATFARVSRRTSLTMGSLPAFSRTDLYSSSNGTAWREPEIFDARGIGEP